MKLSVKQPLGVTQSSIENAASKHCDSLRQALYGCFR